MTKGRKREKLLLMRDCVNHKSRHDLHGESVNLGRSDDEVGVDQSGVADHSDQS